MAKIVKDGGIVDDEWQLILDNQEGLQLVEEKRLILPLSLWIEQRDQQQRNTSNGVWLENPDDLSRIAAELKNLPLVAVRFNAFTDGRGFSVAATLRENHGFGGEIRAFGELMIDQLPLLRRCGFNTFVLKDDSSCHQAVELLADSPLSYQGSVYSPRTPFRFRFAEEGLHHADS